MSTIKEILTRLINSDTALRGFTATNLPLAAKLRAINTAAALERYFNHEELVEIATWAKSSGGFDAAVASFRSGECCYYVCADDSLYFASNAESEVWFDANDFAIERIVKGGYDGPLDSMDADLLKYLGIGTAAGLVGGAA
jgi:hypothetical protein